MRIVVGMQRDNAIQIEIVQVCSADGKMEGRDGGGWDADGLKAICDGVRKFKWRQNTFFFGGGGKME